MTDSSIDPTLVYGRLKHILIFLLSKLLKRYWMKCPALFRNLHVRLQRLDRNTPPLTFIEDKLDQTILFIFSKIWR